MGKQRSCMFLKWRCAARLCAVLSIRELGPKNPYVTWMNAARKNFCMFCRLCTLVFLYECVLFCLSAWALIMLCGSLVTSDMVLWVQWDWQNSFTGFCFSWFRTLYSLLTVFVHHFAMGFIAILMEKHDDNLTSFAPTSRHHSWSPHGCCWFLLLILSVFFFQPTFWYP